MNYLFTSESVSEGHPDKVADQISDALLDEFLAYDPQSKVACETLVTTGQVVLAGEVKSRAYIDLHEVARRVINRIGYTRSEYKFDGDSCGVFSAIHEQSADINRGVERSESMNQGAGDQGMMFGYACNETDNYMPLALDLSHLLLRELAMIRREKNEMPYLRPDAKSQVTVEYDEQHRPVRIHTIVISTQHDEFIAPTDHTPEAQAKADKEMLDRIADDVRRILLPRVIAQLPKRVQALFDGRLLLHVNPTGKFVIGGPHGDTGLTGRKIIVLIQVSYAIGVAQPVSLFVDTNHTSHVAMSDAEIADKIGEIFDLRPKAIEERLKLRNPIYEETAAYGHMGRQPRTVHKTFTSRYEKPVEVDVELFTWEKLDYVDTLKKAFSL